MTHSEIALQYMKAVASGDVLACKQIRAQVQRVLSDFTRQGDTAFQYYYDAQQADRVCNIVEMFGHVRGRWAARGERIHLEPWQKFWITTMYGWKRRNDNTRRYRRATIILPRKNGKTLIVAALMLYHLIFDGEFGAEAYCGASSQVQAKECFSAAQQMLLNAPDLRLQTGAEVNAASLIVPETNSKAMPVIARPKDGSNVSLGILDEVHQCLTLDLYDSFQTGSGARMQPVIQAISTAGFGLENPCRQLQLDAEKVLNGIVEDDELFSLIFTIDPEIDWKSDIALRMANPNAGVSVAMEFLQAAQREAINNPTKAASFKTKHLDITVASSKSFYSIEKWNGCKDAMTLDNFKGEECWLGLDLSSKLDLTAIAVVFRRHSDGQSNFYAFADCFAPEESIQNTPLYVQWSARGLLHVTEGNTIDYTALEALILSHCERFKVQEIAFDPWHSDFFIQSLTPKLSSGTKFVEVPQRATHLTAPMRLLEELTYNKRIHHSGDPVLTFGVGNVVAKQFGNLIMPAKEKQDQKIDPAVALMMALSRASIAPEHRSRRFTPQVW